LCNCSSNFHKYLLSTLLYVSGNYFNDSSMLIYCSIDITVHAWRSGSVIFDIVLFNKLLVSSICRNYTTMMLLHQNNQLLVHDKRCLVHTGHLLFSLKFWQKFRGTRRRRKKSNLGLSPTDRLSTADANSHASYSAHRAPLPCRAVALRNCSHIGIFGTRLRRGMGTAWSRHGHGMGTAWARHGHGMACVNQTRSHSVNQMGKTISKPLSKRLGRETAGARQGMCELALIALSASSRYYHILRVALRI
jgi:hypothetical protein